MKRTVKDFLQVALLLLLACPAWANIYLGSYPAGTTNITFMFSTADAAGGRVAPSSAFENADIVIASPGQSDCVGSTDADPLTIASPYNSKVGLHRVVIDSSDNTCSGFFAAGRTYYVYLYPDETVDGQSVSAVIAYFSIDREDITASRIAASAIGASELAADSITSSEIADNAIDAGAISANAITSSELATDAIGAAQIAASAITSSEAPNLDAAVSSRSTLTAANVWDALLTGITTVGSIGKLIKDNLDAAITSRLASGTVAADVTAILADTAAMDTSSELRTLLFGSDTAGATATALSTVAGYVDTEVADILADTVAIQGATFNGTTDSLEAIRDRGDAAWTTATGFSTLDAAGVRGAVGLATANLDTQLGALQTDLDNPDQYKADVSGLSTFDPTTDEVQIDAGSVDDIWDELIADHGLAGTFGLQFLSVIPAIRTAAVTDIPAQIDALHDLSGPDAEAAALAAINAYDPPTKAELDSAESDIRGADSDTLETLSDQIDAIDPTAPPSVESIVAGVWNELLAGHTTAGTSGNALSDAATASAAAPTAEEITDAVWNEATADHATAGSTGAALTASSDAGDATAANQTLILNSLSAAKGATFDTATDSLEAIRNRGDAAWYNNAGAGTAIVTSETLVDGEDMRVVHVGTETGIEGVRVLAYVKSDYDGGNYVVRAETYTLADGSWGPINLSPGVEYTLRFHKPGVYGPVSLDMTPEAEE